MAEKTQTLEKIYKKINKLEEDVQELKYAILPVEKISKKELAEFKKTSKQMEKGEFLTTKQAIQILEK